MRLSFSSFSARRIFDSGSAGGRNRRPHALFRSTRRKRGLLLCFFLLSTGLLTSGFWSAGSVQERQILAVRRPLTTDTIKTSRYRSSLQAVSLELYRGLPETAKAATLPELMLISFDDTAIQVAGMPARDLAATAQWGLTPQSPIRFMERGLLEAENVFMQCDFRGKETDSSAFLMPPALQLDKRAEQYAELIKQYAAKYNLSPGLVYAIMRTESAFNPFAVSHAGALGLMQLVPDTAGSEVHSFITGRRENPGKTVLFNPESNIQYGSAYLHLLHTRYFQGVSNPTSRQLCVIAAYNGGPGTVFRVFSPNRADAVSAINRLTPEQLYRTLVKKLPSRENRQYVDKVLGHIPAPSLLATAN